MYEENQEYKRSSNIVAAMALDHDIRMRSSSGGIFYLLGRKILSQGGVVFGASWDGTTRVYHKCVTTLEELQLLCGSKYVHSDMRECLHQARCFLDEGRQVLFSGTPCQIAAFRKTLHDYEYHNLYTQDCFCHGVPPANVWRQWILCLEAKHNSPVVKVQFRCKESGWHNYSICYEFANGEVLKIPFFQDTYMQLFLANISLMKACYQCHFRGLQRASDITLGDFWGVERFMPEIDDDRGISLCIMHSERGKELFNSILSDIDYVPVVYEHAIACNPSAIKNEKSHPRRDYFFNNLDIMSFDVLAKKCLQRSIIERIVSRFHRLFL